MAINSYSRFIYGHSIDDSNNYIDFSEDTVTEIGATIETGSYTLTDFVDAVLTAMNDVGGQEYTASLNRETRKITLSAAANFDLFVIGGSHISISAFNLMGFTSNRTGLNSYEGDIASGSYYDPQFLLQDYIDFEDNVKTAQASVNESASGKVEVVSFGKNKFAQFNIALATDIVPQGVIKENVNGVSDLRDFMNYAIEKKPMEFVKDIGLFNEFHSIILESTAADRKGTGFTLYELYSKKMIGYFETKKLIFRELK